MKAKKRVRTSPSLTYRNPDSSVLIDRSRSRQGFLFSDLRVTRDEAAELTRHRASR
jgi:hypothetical protein